MRKYIVYSIVVLAAALCIGALSSCQSEPKEHSPPISLAVIFSHRAGNSASSHYFDIRLEGDKEPLLFRAAAPGSQIIGVTSSGSPFQGERTEIPESDAVTIQQARDDQFFFANREKEKLIATQANAPEADAFGALTISANWLKNQPREHQKYVLVIDNGICTTGPMSFLQEGFLLAEPEDIVNKLADRGALPDLTDVTVVFAMLGRTSSPQTPPGMAAQKHLETIWELIVTTGGGKAMIIRDLFESSAPDSRFPVSVVRFPPDQPLRFDPGSEIAERVFEYAQFLGEDQVQFIGDSAQYLHPERAESVIEPIAGFMNSNPGFTMLLVGTTAGDETTQYSISLSKSRADAVKETLVLFGVPEERIITVGLGSLNPWHIHGVGTSGPEASLNRKVVLLSASSPEAAEILRRSTPA